MLLPAPFGPIVPKNHSLPPPLPSAPISETRAPSMDQERTCFIFFLVHFVLLFPCILCSLQGKNDSALAGNLTFDLPPSSLENATFDGESSLMNESSQFFSCAADISSLLGPKANSSVSFSTELSFSHENGNSLVFFLSSEKLLLDEPVQTAKNGPLINSTDLLVLGNGGLVKAGDFYHINRVKNPVLSAKSNLGFKSRSTEISRPGSPHLDNHGNKDIVYCVCTPVLAIMSVFSALWSFLRRLFKKKEKTPKISPPQTPASTRDSSISNLLAGHRRFTYRELSLATKHFHRSELLGEGRYASVYRAVFRGSVIMYAVKRFNQSASSKFSFELEATTIHRLRHRRILELRGWCDENPEEPLLLYEYMHNKSLHEALRSRFRPLPWPLRYSIAVGVAEALVYLHEDCLPHVIHSDIKEGNVMLDADFNPKLGDFGLAMSVPPYTIRRERTERDPPECQPFEEVTEKLDVYLYGSLLLALCCRRTEQLRKFYRQLQNLKLEGRLLEAADQRLSGNYSEEEMLRFLNVALQCLEQKVQMRPSMIQVLQMLTGTGAEMEEPEPIFHIEL